MKSLGNYYFLIRQKMERFKEAKKYSCLCSLWETFPLHTWRPQWKTRDIVCAPNEYKNKIYVPSTRKLVLSKEMRKDIKWDTSGLIKKIISHLRKITFHSVMSEMNNIFFLFSLFILWKKNIKFFQL